MADAPKSPGKRDIDGALLLALASGAGAAGAAKQAGCSERTVRRRLADAAFRQRVHEMRGELVQSAVGRLATLGAIAADELHRLILRGDSDQIKLGACRAVLGYMLAGHSNETLARQVEELRRQMEELEHGAGHSADPGAEDASTAGAAIDEGDTHPGPHSPGANGNHDAGGPATRSVADGAADGEDDIHPLFA
jgi:hypothetical protein